MNLPSFADKTREKLAEILPSFQSSDTYRKIGDVVGKAFSDGKKLK